MGEACNVNMKRELREASNANANKNKGWLTFLGTAAAGAFWACSAGEHENGRSLQCEHEEGTQRSL
eukprot:1158699-Pelagomonas_calceolata.AAC.4